MPDDDFAFYKPKRPRNEVVEEALGRLTFASGAVAQPKRQGPMDMTEAERAAFHQRQDRMFADGYVEIVGAPQPLSRELALQFHYEVDRLPSPGYDVGNDDGEDA